MTPLQMAMVAAGIANGGSVMQPFVVDRILKPDGSILTKTAPEEYSQAVSPPTAAELTAMMELVVESGTGTAAQIPGVRVAGKTGTAETGREGQNDVWFIGFAPADNPQVAVAVALSDQAATGGAVAAPIARAIMETLLRESRSLFGRDLLMARLSDTLIDTIFDGRYRIVRRLGAGGMANVYLAEDTELGRPVAIKILNDRYANDDLFVERFRREAKSAASLSHPNIVSIYDRGEAEGTYYIAMEVIEGRSLKEVIRASGRLRPAQAIAYTRQILSALRFAHRNGIIHRDIKPHNILIGPEERLKVTDFGIARAGASQMTETGSIMGTAQYLSPGAGAGRSGHRRRRISTRSGSCSTRCSPARCRSPATPPVEIAMKHLQRAAAAAVLPGARNPGRPRPRRRSSAGQEPGRSLRERRGVRLRPRADRSRAPGRAGDGRGGDRRARRSRRRRRRRCSAVPRRPPQPPRTPPATALRPLRPGARRSARSGPGCS